MLATLKPQQPEKAEGMRIDPPESLPSPHRDPPDVISAASPPDEPPHVREQSCGLVVVPGNVVNYCRYNAKKNKSEDVRKR